MVRPNEVQPLCVNRECKLILYLWGKTDLSPLFVWINIYERYILFINPKCIQQRVIQQNALRNNSGHTHPSLCVGKSSELHDVSHV